MALPRPLLDSRLTNEQVSSRSPAALGPLLGIYFGAQRPRFWRHSGPLRLIDSYLPLKLSVLCGAGDPLSRCSSKVNLEFESSRDNDPLGERPPDILRYLLANTTVPVHQAAQANTAALLCSSQRSGRQFPYGLEVANRHRRLLRHVYMIRRLPSPALDEDAAPPKHLLA